MSTLVTTNQTKVGTSLICEAFATTYVRARENVPSKMLQRAEVIALNAVMAMAQAIEIDMGYLRSLLDFLTTVLKSDINGELFQSFVLPSSRGGFFDSAMKAVAFVPHVLQHNTDPVYASIAMNRTQVESDGKRWYDTMATLGEIPDDAVKNYNFKELINGSEQVRREMQDYHPIHYIEPVIGNEAEVGFDVQSDPKWFAAVQAAETNYGTAITGRIEFSQAGYEQYGFLIFAPMFQNMSNPVLFEHSGKGVAHNDWWPVALAMGVYEVEDLLASTFQQREFASFPRPVQAGSGIVTLVFQKLGYQESGWEFLAGFTTALNRSNASEIDAFNRGWKAREGRLPIVANELFCHTISIDQVGSVWMLMVGIDYGCQQGERLVVAGFPGESLTLCAECPAGTYCSGLDGQIASILPGYWAAEDLSVFSCGDNPSWCPGGAPRTCADGRIGMVCAECEIGKKASRGAACVPCGGSDIAPFIVICIAIFILLCITYRSISSGNAATNRHSILLIMCACGLLVNVVQQISVISSLSIPWQQPLKSFLLLFKWVQLDFEIINFNCVTPINSVTKFFGTLSIVLICAAVVLMIHFFWVLFARQGRFQHEMPALIGTLGTCVMVCFITIVDVGLAPLQCSPNPNGLDTVRRYPTELCNFKSDHLLMVCGGLVFLLLPLAFLVHCTYVLLQVPARMRAMDTRFLKTYQFVLFRYKSDHYIYAAFYLVRNLLLTLAPILESLTLQILAVHVLLMGSSVVTCLHFPLRVPLANWLEFSTTAMLVLLMCVIAFFVSTPPDKSNLALACVVGGIFVLSLAILAPLVGIFRFCAQRVRKPYQFFLCHHKEGAGAFARLLKMVLVERSRNRRGVFVDSDNLKSLDALFDQVRTQTDMLVPLCSVRIFLRPWPVGEVVTAHLAKVKLVTVLYQNFEKPTLDFIAHYSELVPDVRCLGERNITLPMIRAALLWVRDQPSIDLPNDGWQTPFLISLTDTLHSRPVQSGQLASNDAGLTLFCTNQKSDAGTKACALVDISDMEAASSAQVLCKMLLPHLSHHSDLIPFVMSKLEQLTTNIERVIIICTTGAFYQRYFVSCLFECKDMQVFYLPVVTEANFCFPTEAFLDGLRALGPTLFGCNGLDLVDLVRVVFTPIALSFPATFESDATLKPKAVEVSRRLLELYTAGTRMGGALVSVRMYNL